LLGRRDVRALMALGYEHLSGLWEEGERRLREADPPLRTLLERVVGELVLELRRRLGGRFTTTELAELYLRDGIDWCFEIAVRVAPGEPEAWDVGMVGNAAYARYVHSASDFGGGRRYYSDDSY
jgi:hypothetical protein